MFNRFFLCALALFFTVRAFGELRVGSASADLEADDSMIIAGGIGPGKAVGQEGKLRCVATIIEQQTNRLAIVACDVLMMTRQTLDPVVERIERELGIPSANVLINCTHTHHAPSTMKIHGYGADDIFTKTGPSRHF